MYELQVKFNRIMRQCVCVVCTLSHTHTTPAISFSNIAINKCNDNKRKIRKKEFCVCVVYTICTSHRTHQKCKIAKHLQCLKFAKRFSNDDDINIAYIQITDTIEKPSEKQDVEYTVIRSYIGLLFTVRFIVSVCSCVLGYNNRIDSDKMNQ